jgi:hypothetical protein
MDNLVLRFDFDPNRRVVGKTNTAPLVIEVRIQGTQKKVRIPTGIKLLKSQVAGGVFVGTRNTPMVAIETPVWGLSGKQAYRSTTEDSRWRL